MEGRVAAAANAAQESKVPKVEWGASQWGAVAAECSYQAAFYTIPSLAAADAGASGWGSGWPSTNELLD